MSPSPRRITLALVDTCVWVRFFASRAPFATELDRLLAGEQAAGHDLIFGELMDSSLSHDEVVAFVRMRKLPISALVADAKL